MALLSYRKYAAHRGVTLAAVQKAIKTGRINPVVDQATGKLKIDPAIADAQWARNTDPEQQLRGNGGVPPSGPAAQLPLGGDTGVAGGADDEAGGDDRQALLRSRAESADLENQIKRIELARKRGELVSIAEEREVRQRRYRGIRDKWLGMPDREAALMAAELKVDAVQLHAALTRFVRKALHELSDEARADAGRGIAEPVAA